MSIHVLLCLVMTPETITPSTISRELRLWSIPAFASLLIPAFVAVVVSPWSLVHSPGALAYQAFVAAALITAGVAVLRAGRYVSRGRAAHARMAVRAGLVVTDLVAVGGIVASLITGSHPLIVLSVVVEVSGALAALLAAATLLRALRRAQASADAEGAAHTDEDAEVLDR